MIGLHKLNKLFINYITYDQSVQPDSIANNDGGFGIKILAYQIVRLRYRNHVMFVCCLIERDSLVRTVILGPPR